MEIFHIKLGFVNAYLVKLDKEFILIDTGISTEYKNIKEELTRHGCIKGNLKLIILTHRDQDHTGNCHALAKEYDAKIAMNKLDYDIMQSNNPPKRKIKPLIMRFLFMIFRLLRRNAKLKLFTPDIFLKDNEDLKKYGFDAKVLYVPGHTKGSIVIVTKEGDIFSGDTIINAKGPKFAHIIENQDDLDQSIKKLKTVKFKMVYPGHGMPFKLERFEDIKNS